jgi:hypothetical protein
MDIDARRKELINEINEFQSQDQFITDTKKTIQELNEERDSHSNLIQQINQVCLYELFKYQCFAIQYFFICFKSNLKTVDFKTCHNNLTTI